MPSGIGETLREARQEAGVQLDEVERTIRIRGKYLAALENEDWGVLPADAYLRGFLHTYADYLGLDGAALVDEYDRLGIGREHEHPIEASPGFEPPRPVDGGGFWTRPLAIGVGIVAALAVLFVVLAITGGSEKNGGGNRHHHGRKHAGGQTTSTTTTTSTPTEATVTLQPTGTVWVCLVNHAGTPLVNGETLTAGDDRGPFKDTDMKLNLGNGEIRIQLNGKPVPIPSPGATQGFSLTPTGAKPLSSSARPTCS
jgi:cytoskeleton protein RodZ